MNVQKSCFEIESANQSISSESIVEGALSLPVDKDEIARVLLVSGKVYASAEPGEGKVFMDGSVTFTVVYVTADGAVDSFDSAAPFRHSEDAPGMDASMNVYAKGGVRETSHSVEDGRTVYVKGIVSMALRATGTKTCDAVSGSDSGGLETKMYTGKLAAAKEFKKETVTLREDFRVPQSMPRAEQVLMCDAYPVVQSVRLDETKIAVEGEMKIMVLYRSEDKSAPLQYFYESLPFGEIISSDSVTTDDLVWADAGVGALSVGIAEEASDLLSMTCKLMIVCGVRSLRDIEYMQDAYALDRKLDISYDTLENRSLKLSGCAKAIARCAITVPENEPNVNRVLCMKACPVVSAATPGADRVSIEGLMMFTVCYASPEGMASFSGEVPFEAEAQMEGMMSTYDVEVGAETEYCSFEGAGREIGVRFMMDVMVHAYKTDQFSMVSDMEETEGDVPVRKGITIYFADGGESTWDIAKRYATTLGSVKKFNPDIGESAAAGQKILIVG